MKMRFLHFLLLLISLPVSGQHFLPHRHISSIPASVDPCLKPAGYLIDQTLETATSGWDHCETWTLTGTPNANTVVSNYTGFVLQGTQSLLVSTNTGMSPQVFSPAYAAQSEVWMYYLVRFTAWPASGNPSIAGIATNGISVVDFRLNEVAKTLRCFDQVGATAQATGTLSLNTTYSVWLHYKASTANNGIVELAFSTDPAVKPISGTNYAIISNSTQNSKANKCWVGTGTINSSSEEYIFDQMIISTNAIGASPL